jgi:hypothetical protein
MEHFFFLWFFSAPDLARLFHLKWKINLEPVLTSAY